MRSLLCSALFLSFLHTFAFTQESTQGPGWEIMPGVTFVKLFPGAELEVPVWGGTTGPAFSGTGLKFTARCFTPAYPSLAFTFGGGVSWFYDPEDHYAVVAAAPGTGAQLWRESFTVFPLSMGAQWIFPSDAKQDVMFYAGGEANVNFINGHILPGEQTKVGYTVLGGFVVKVFEFGVRYSAFSDLKNLGVQIGLRFHSFMLQ